MNEQEESAGAALHAAIAAGDLDAVERELAAGVSPLAVREGESALWAADRQHDGGPEGRKIVHAIRRAARAAAEGSTVAPPGLTTAPPTSPFVLQTARGMRELRDALAVSQALDVLLLEGDVKTAARTLDKCVQSPRREVDVAGRPVAGAPRLVFVLRLKGSPWTILPLSLEKGSRWNIDEVPELEARGAGLGPLAVVLAVSAGARVMHLKFDRFTLYSAEGELDARIFEPESWWAPDVLPAPDEAATLLPAFDGDERELLDAAARRREQLRRMDEALAELGAFVPPMRIHSDGYHAQIELSGLAPTDVERVDLVVLRELGEPLVDRRPAQPGTEPARVEPAAPEPPLAHAPPPRVEEPGPDLSEAPPLVREPPPLVAPPPPEAPAPPLVEPGAPKAAPPLVKPPPVEDAE